MIDLELNNEIKGRFSIEEVASDNEEEFVKNIPEKSREFDIFSNIPSFKMSKPHLSKKKEFIYKEISTSFPTGFKCEVLNDSTKSYLDFRQIWTSFKENYNVDESNLHDLHFNVNKEKDFMKITDFFETHSDFKDNFFIHNDFIDRSPRQKSTQKTKVIFEKNKDCFITDRITALNSTLDSCLNIKKFCSIGTQTDATFEPEFKISCNNVILQKNNKFLIKKKNKKQNKKRSKYLEKNKIIDEISLKLFESNNNFISETQIKIKSQEIEEISPIIKLNNFSNFFKNSKISKEREYENEIALINLNDNCHTIKKTETFEICSQYTLEKVSNFTISNLKTQLCEKCTLIY